MKSLILTNFVVDNLQYLCHKYVVKQPITSHNNKITLLNKEILAYWKVWIITMIFFSCKLERKI